MHVNTRNTDNYTHRYNYPQMTEMVPEICNIPKSSGPKYNALYKGINTRIVLKTIEIEVFFTSAYLKIARNS